MNNRTRNILVASLGTGTAAVALCFIAAGCTPKIDLNPYEALGTVTAEETVKLLGAKGQVLVMARDAGADKNPSVEAELKAFRQTLKKHAGISLVSERILATPMLMMATGGGVPPDQLFKALETHPKVGALVLFCSLPALTDAELESLKEASVKTIVVSAFHSRYRELLEDGVIHRAIVPRPEAPPADAPAPRTVRERFDQDYAIVTPANAAGWQ